MLPCAVVAERTLAGEQHLQSEAIEVGDYFRTLGNTSGVEEDSHVDRLCGDTVAESQALLPLLSSMKV